MKGRLNKIIAIGTKISLALFLFLSTAFIVCWTWPALLINSANATRVFDVLKKNGVEITSASLKVEAISLSFFRKQIVIAGENLCLNLPDATMSYCFRNADITAELDIKGWFPRYRVGPVKLSGGVVNIDLGRGDNANQPASSQAPEASEYLLPSPPSFFSAISFSSLSLDVTRFELLLGETKVMARVRVDALGEERNSRWITEVEGNLVSGRDRYSGHVFVNLFSRNSVWFGPYNIHGSARAELPGKTLVDLKLEGMPKGDRAIVYKLDSEVRFKGKRIVGQIDGSASLRGLHFAVNARGANLIPHLPTAALKNCRVDYEVVLEEKNIRRLRADCPLVLSATFKKFDKGPLASMYEKMEILLRSDLKLQTTKAGKEWVDGNLELKMDRLLSKASQGKGALTTRVSGDLYDFPHQWKFDSKLILKIEEFHRLVKAMQNFPWAVPRPFSDLSGPLDLTIEGNGELASEGGILPIKLTTRLSSRHQKVWLDGNGELKLKLKPRFSGHLKFDLDLNDVRLTLPHLDLASPPRFIPDDRIHSLNAQNLSEEAKKKAEPPAFTYELRVTTPPGRTVRLTSNLAKKEVPIVLALRMATKNPMRGFVRVHSFPVELFHRKATVQHLDLGFGNDPNKTEVNGEIRVDYTDYLIRIKILGLIQEPNIKFSSEPPLPEDQVMSVLLFGKKTDQLDANQARSVNASRGAVADSAISLASMYVLASTPIESIGYNPDSHTITAKLKLANGTTLTVGMGSNIKDKDQLGLTKRLGPHWSISTLLQNPMNPMGRTLQAFLEWSTGY